MVLRRLLGVAVALSAAWSSIAAAQAIAIAPVTIALRPGELTTTVTVTNRGPSETAVQVRAFDWDQAGGEDRLEPTRDLLVSPPISKIGPGQTQIVRLLLKRPATAEEGSYRIFFDDIPTALPANGVRVALRISVPVFAAAAVPAKAQLSWRAETGGPGEAVLSIANSGLRHAHLADLRVILADRGEIRPQGAASLYVLSGATIHLRLAGHAAGLAPGATLRISARSEGGEIVVPVLILPRR